MRLFTALGCTLLFGSIAYSAEPDVRVQVIDSKKFVCFTEPDAQTLLQMRLDYPKLELKITKLEEQVGLKEAQIQTLTTGNANLLQQIKIVQTENVRLTNQLESGSAWYRNPYLWFCVGIVTGAGLATGIAFAIK